MNSVLKPSDLNGLNEPVSVLKQLRDHHHKIARMCAEGMRTTDIAYEMGMSISRISILRNDPAFKQLIEVYRPQVEERREQAYADLWKRKLANAMLSSEVYYDRLADTPELVSTGELQAEINDALDRLGHVKVSKTINASVDLRNLADHVAAGRRAADQLSAADQPLIEGETSGQPATASPPSGETNGSDDPPTSHSG